MKKFLFKLSFLTIPILGVLFLIILTFNISSAYLRNYSKFYKTDNKINTLILGDSHISHAINDNLILNSKNLAKPSEPFYYTYYKLILFTKENTNIKNIYLGFGYHSLSSSYDQFIKGWFSSNTGPAYFFILPLKQQLKVLYWNKKKVLFFLKRLIKVFIYHRNEIHNRETSLSHGFDNFFPKSCVNKDSIYQRTKFQFYEKYKLSDTLSPAKLNHIYLEKIIKYCNKNNLNLILLSTPIHKENYIMIPFIFKKLFLSLKGPKKIDLTSYIKDDCKFSPDGDHVNKLGAEITTRALIRKLY